MFNQQDKTALITGASGSIGSACARMLHKHGAHVVISGTNLEKLEGLAAELGDNCTVRTCNLRDKAECENLVDSIDNLDILICNAGITKDQLSMRMSDQDFCDVIDVNLISTFVLNRTAIKKMIKSRWGRIVNISSVVGFAGNPGQANYVASKAGVVGMTKSLAQEIATRGVTVNCIAPGFIVSNMTDKLSDAQKEAISKKIPIGRLGVPEDIASGVLYLASAEAAYVTGQTLHINGGMLMV